MEKLVEMLAINSHDSWSEKMVKMGYKYSLGMTEEKTSRLLLPYSLLFSKDKDFEKRSAEELIKCILVMNFKIKKNINYHKEFMENIKITEDIDLESENIANKYKQQLFNIYIRIAARNGNVNLIPSIISSNELYLPDINSTDVYGHNALYLAVKRGHKDIVEKLIKLGALVNLPDNNGLTPLMVASFLGNHEICQILLNNGAKIDQKDRRNLTAL